MAKKFGEASLVLFRHLTVFTACTVTFLLARGTVLGGLWTRIGSPPVLLCFIHKDTRGLETCPPRKLRPSEIFTGYYHIY